MGFEGRKPLKLKVFGERNSGTNILEKLLVNSLGVRALPGSPPYRWTRLFGLGNSSMTAFFRLTEAFNLGWKHSVPNVERIMARGVFTVTVVKNPYSWLLSLHRRPYHNPEAKLLPFDEFLGKPWPVLGCEGFGGRIPSPMDLWNIKNSAYLRACETLGESILLRYEDFLQDSLRTVHECARGMGIPLPEDVDLTVISRAAKSRDQGRSIQYYRDYYLGEQWRQEIPGPSIDLINGKLDSSLMEGLGYKFV